MLSFRSYSLAITFGAMILAACSTAPTDHSFRDDPNIKNTYQGALGGLHRRHIRQAYLDHLHHGETGALPQRTVMKVANSFIRQPKNLLGLDEHEIAGLLGKPFFVRQDLPAVILQYRNDACVLDIFFYGPEKRESPRLYRANYIEVRAHGRMENYNANSKAAERCLERLFRPKNIS